MASSFTISISYKILEDHKRQARPKGTNLPVLCEWELLLVIVITGASIKSDTAAASYQFILLMGIRRMNRMVKEHFDEEVMKKSSEDRAI
ncbi:uncharacterized protein Bfra_000310 [Botrytis fragariae]|uniref:Uncharacterized protein n=1 Tax=Botrytis fragariae TaxID=1964551 RepID=A0A8H6B2W1_9HELO|nr:uncharacterized protein Bfra_000310 [Botrytis fragariae]KAF5878143.1 hypothetical protein Bfra_000310 [Botrytis fragariae]